MNTLSQPVEVEKTRLDSVDLLRGLVMVIMALDHVRIYFNNSLINPEDIRNTYMALFLTRWITHYCAPIFFFLAGTGAYLSLARGKTLNQVSKTLWTRGLWLVFLEMTVIGFSWSFKLGYNFGGVIWALGWCMVIMSLIVRLPLIWIAVLGVGMMVFHHLLDTVSPASFGQFSWLWIILRGGEVFSIPYINQQFFILYALIPSIGVMASGYALGRLLTKPEEKRRRWLLILGAAMTLAFFILRATNLYGYRIVPTQFLPRVHFMIQPDWEHTIISFLLAQKYPFSLQFLLMTLGPGLLLLAVFDRIDLKARINWLWSKIVVIGRVPMFYYVQHILLIHILAVGVAYLWGQPINGLLGQPLPFVRPGPPNVYGHDLPFVYFITIMVSVILYFPCRWFANLKKRRKDWWLSYL